MSRTNEDILRTAQGTRGYLSTFQNKSGIDFELAKSKLLRKALETPHEYYAIREKVLGAALTGLTDELHKKLYFIMTTGTTDGATPIAGPYNPALPAGTADDIAYSVAKNLMDTIQREVIDVILPESILDIVKGRAMEKAGSKLSELA